MQKELFLLTARWAAKTNRLLKKSIDDKKVIDTGDLKSGLSQNTKASGDRVLAQFKFKRYGRFVDMGARRKSQKAQIESALGVKKKKGKKWYSPIFFARLNQLRSAIGFTISEEVLNEFKENLNGKI